MKCGKNAIPRRTRICFISLTCLLAVLIVMALSVGKYHITPAQLFGIIISEIAGRDYGDPMAQSVFFTIRAPRVFAAVIIGAALSEAGASYQGVFKNPMVSPDLLGVSAGACVGAAGAILLGLNAFWVQILAFSCGIISVILTCAIPRLLKNRSTLMLVLAGVVVSGMMNAIVGIFKYKADVDSQLADIVYWMMGSINGVHWNDLSYCAPIIVISCIALILLRWRLNIIALGDKDAYYLGMNVNRMRGCVIFFSTLLTASSVCLCGAVNWVGLVIPHMGRLLVGKNNRWLMPVSALLGACFLVLADTAARTLGSSDIPLSILTGLFGAPMFVLFLKMQKEGRGQ